MSDIKITWQYPHMERVPPVQLATLHTFDAFAIIDDAFPHLYIATWIPHDKDFVDCVRSSLDNRGWHPMRVPKEVEVRKLGEVAELIINRRPQ